MSEAPPVIWWIRRDLRLCDNPALQEALRLGQPVVPVYIYDTEEAQLGAAPKFRLGLGLERFAQTLEAMGSRLIVQRGAALDVLQTLSAETGARHVVWSRLYDPAAIARDTQIKTELTQAGLQVTSTGGRLLFEPWTVQTKAGGMFKVYTPMWKAVRGRVPDALIAPPSQIPPPRIWPDSLALADLELGADMHRGASVVAPYCVVGEGAAQARLQGFMDTCVDLYKSERDFLDHDACSGLSENLAWGEISPHRIWFAAQDAMSRGDAGAEHFLKELVWREFSYHLLYHTPHIIQSCWRPQWDDFPWQTSSNADLIAWQRGQTGNDLVDAAMRELYVTGRMHNRARMIVASYLCKHLMIHWKFGMEWFAQCLVDWDPAANAMGWQWVAGCGPDAAPYFRIYNPDGQREKFDPDQIYLKRWIAEGQTKPPSTARSFFDAAPVSWKLDPSAPRPAPIIELKAGRMRALSVYETHRAQTSSV